MQLWPQVTHKMTTPRARHHARVGNLSAAVTPADRELTVGKRLSDVVLHFRDTGAIEVGAVHESTLVRAAGQLTEEVHEVAGTSRTPAHRDTAGR